MTEATETAAPAPVVDNTILCKINDQQNLQIDMGLIPANVRLELLKGAIRDNVRNRLTSVNSRFNKANEAWSAYDKAIAADPAQTAVPKPEGERPVLDLVTAATKARDDLYNGNIRALAEKKERTTVDPLVKLVTDAVVREVFEKAKANGENLTFVAAKAKVGKNGIEYLDARIAELVAAGADAAALAKMKEDRYLKPARIMLGTETPKAVKDGLAIL